VFPATRELLFNVIKHAGVTKTRAEWTWESGSIRVAVGDAGLGFEPSQLN